jgi:hypothetical protein
MADAMRAAQPYSGRMKLIALCFLAAAAAAAHAQPCELARADRAWAESALRNWRLVERDALKLPPAPFPKIVAIDEHCTAIGKETATGTFAWQGTAHAGEATLPDGKSVAVGPISFAAPDPSARRATFFAMSTPSVWRAKGVQSALGLEKLMDGVLLHEMSHTRQFEAVAAHLEHVPDDIGDDSLQEAFAKNPDYVRDYEAERDLLYAAAHAASDAEARSLAAQALEHMRKRRDRWFAGDNAKWREIDDTFLAMEGLGQWVIHWWFTSPQGLALDAVTAEREVRRNRKWWTQDEGLALFLVIDRLLPGWQSRAFRPDGALAEELLAAAVR